MHTNIWIGRFLLALGIGLLSGRTPAAEKSTAKRQPAKNTAGTWKPVAVWKVKQAAHLLEFSPDGKILASGGVDGVNNLGQLLPGEITLWDMTRRKVRFSLKGHKGTIAGLAFTSDGKTLLSVCYGGLLKHWDVASGKARSTVRLALSEIIAAAFSPNRKTLATGVGNLQPNQAQRGGQVQLWNVATGKMRGSIRAHDIHLAHLFYSPSGKTLVSLGASFNKNARVAPDGTSDAFVGETRFWDAATGRLKPIKTTRGSTCVFSPEGTVFVTDTYDQASRGYRLKFYHLVKKTAHTSRTGHKGMLYGLACTRDGKTLASASFDKTVKLWDLASAKELATLTGHRSWVSAVAFAPDGKTLVSASADSTLRIWSPVPQ
jgi:WD40 repeat protein